MYCKCTAKSILCQAKDTFGWTYLQPIIMQFSLHQSFLFPLYVAASSENIEMLKSFVEHINYVDNINEKCDGLAPIEAAVKAGHFEIVNKLILDLNKQLPSLICHKIIGIVSSIYALYSYRSNFHEWEKWAKKQENQEDAQVPIQNCNCCEIPKKKVRQEIPDIDFSEMVLDDSDDDEVEEVVEDEDGDEN